VGEIDDLHHSENEGQTKGHENIQGGKKNPCDQKLKEQSTVIHRPPLLKERIAHRA
jgi:hypothetical protein